MFSELPSSLPSAWTWIASLYIIDVIHFGIPCPYSYHHIPYALHVEVQHDLHIPLVRLAIDPFDITVWHASLFFHSWYISFLPWGGEKSHQDIHAHLH